MIATGYNAAAVAVTDGTVFFTDDATSGALMKVGVNGGTITPAASPEDGPWHVITNGSSVFFGDYASSGAVIAVPLDGGAPITVGPAQAYPRTLAVDATNLYWTVIPAAIMKVPLSGGTPQQLSIGPATPFGVASDGTTLYWTDPGNHVVAKASIGGGTPMNIATGLVDPTFIFYYAGFVYWTDLSLKTINRVSVSGGTVTQLNTLGDEPYELAVDASGVYGTGQLSSTNCTVAMVPLSGAPEVILAQNRVGTEGIALDATSVYWAEDGSVAKVPKP